jgi:transposase
MERAVYQAAQISKRGLEILPEMEQQLVNGLLHGKNEKQIATMFNVSQGSISSRLAKAAKRVQFWEALPKLNEEDWETLGKFFPAEIVDIARFMVKTSCQSKTAELMTEKYHTRHTQVTIRYRWKKMLKDLVSLNLPGKIRTVLSMIDSNLYIFHEVRFPETWKEKGKHVRTEETKSP